MTNVLQSLLLICLLLSCSTLTESKRKSKTSPKTASTSSSSSATSSSSSSSSKTSSNESPAAGEERRLELAAKLSQFPVLPLSDGNFSKYITSRPRDYWAILMFTALDPKYQCSICSMLYQTFKEVSILYQTQYSFLDDPAPKRLAFFMVDVDKARNKFDEMQLQTVPRLYVLPPREVGASKLKVKIELEYFSPFWISLSLSDISQSYPYVVLSFFSLSDLLSIVVFCIYIRLVILNWI